MRMMILYCMVALLKYDYHLIQQKQHICQFEGVVEHDQNEIDQVLHESMVHKLFTCTI
jgi:hypothetical protein